MTKRKVPRPQDVLTDPKQQLARARRAHANGLISTEDFIWTAMQCYSADRHLSS